jgi:hypothetical protein
MVWVPQSKPFGSMSGKTAQLDIAPEEEELLQGKFQILQRQGPEEEELLQGKFDAIQRMGPEEEEEPLQGKFEPVQRMEPEEEELQMKQGVRSGSAAQLEADPAPRTNNTGLPDNLKSGIESLSGMSMDNVKVHYNSSQPAQLNALAYAQGTDIHVASGQEQHLPHEAWHVVQQAQGRVKPTLQMKGGVPVNDDAGLEHEADVMGARALQRVVNPIQLEKLEGTELELSSHSKDRMSEYGLSSAVVKDVIENGTTYSDTRPQHAGQTIYYKGGVAIAVKGGTITTVMNNARVKKAWVAK